MDKKNTGDRRYFLIPGMSRSGVKVKIPKNLEKKESIPEYNIRERFHQGIKLGSEWVNIFYYNLTSQDFGKYIVAKVEIKKKIIVKNGISCEHLIIDVYKIRSKDVFYKMSFPTENKLNQLSSDQIIDYCQIPGTTNYILFQSFQPFNRGKETEIMH